MKHLVCACTGLPRQDFEWLFTFDSSSPQGQLDVLATMKPTTASADSGRLVLVFAEPRGWKERAGLGDASRRALRDAIPAAGLVVVFGHPRIAAEIPGQVPVLLAWHRQRLMQQAVVGWLEARRR